MNKRETIGSRLRWLRKQHKPKETQDTLADIVGVSRSTIAGIETGIDDGGLATMIAVADHYKVSLDWLLCRNVPEGGPLVGKFIDDPDKLAFVDFWTSLSDDQRSAALRLLRIERRDAVA